MLSNITAVNLEAIMYGLIAFDTVLNEFSTLIFFLIFDVLYNGLLNKNTPLNQF